MTAKLKFNGRELTVKRGKYTYGTGEQLAIMCYDNTDPESCEACGIPYGILTVNLDDPRCEPWGDDQYGMQYLDVNNWPGIEWIIDHDETIDWAEPTGVKQQSGFVTYPMYMFDLSKIEEVNNG